MKAEIKIRKSKLWNLIKLVFPGVVMDDMWLTFGNTIWCPKIGITSDLIEHEAVHCLQQKNWHHAIIWWITYLRSKKFRYSQELPAYKNQYAALCKVYKSRDDRWRFRMSIARIMSGEKYNFMVDYPQALHDLGK